MGVLTAVSDGVRARSLAGDERAGRFARGQARRQHRAFVRRRWRLLLLVAAIGAVTTAVPAYLLNAQLGRGVVIGVGLAGNVGFLAYWVSALTGTAPLLMGELAEQWTASELRALRGEGWRLVNHFGLTSGDIDHVLVGPAGIVVVETKWSASGWDEDWNLEVVRKAAAQAAMDAHRIGLWLKHLEVPAPLSLVVLWGGDAEVLPARPQGRSGLAHGSDLRDRLRALPAGALSEQKVQQVWTRLDEQVRRRDPHEASQHPVPPSLRRVTAHVGVAVIVGLLGFLAVAEVLTTTGSVWIGLAAAAAAGVIVWPLRRFARPRVVATGLLAGLAAAGILVVVSFGAVTLR